MVENESLADTGQALELLKLNLTNNQASFISKEGFKVMFICVPEIFNMRHINMAVHEQ